MLSNEPQFYQLEAQKSADFAKPEELLYILTDPMKLVHLA